MRIQVDILREKPSNAKESTGTGFKLAILLWLTVQNAVNSLLLRYSRVRDVPEMYFSTVAVFWMEVIKLCICSVMVFHGQSSENKGFIGFFRLLKLQVFDHPRDTLKVCIPAILYILQNNLLYVAASHLNAATFMIASQLKIFTTAIFSVLLLNRPILRAQWFSLFVLFVGVSLVQLQPSSTGNDKQQQQKTMTTMEQRPHQQQQQRDSSAENLPSAGDDDNELLLDQSLQQSALTGLVAICIACALSGFSGVYFEKILKDSIAVSLWMRNIQMAVFALPASLAAALIQDGPKIAEHGWMYGWDWVVWLTASWVAIGGLSVAVCIKYASNISKNFATSVAIILATLGSIHFFDFHPSLMFSAGAVLVIASIFLYSSATTFAQCCSHRGPNANGRKAPGVENNMIAGKPRMFG